MSHIDLPYKSATPMKVIRGTNAGLKISFLFSYPQYRIIKGEKYCIRRPVLWMQ